MIKAFWEDCYFHGTLQKPSNANAPKNTPNQKLLFLNRPGTQLHCELNPNSHVKIDKNWWCGCFLVESTGCPTQNQNIWLLISLSHWELAPWSNHWVSNSCGKCASNHKWIPRHWGGMSWEIQPWSVNRRWLKILESNYPCHILETCCFVDWFGWLITIVWICVNQRTPNSKKETQLPWGRLFSV